MIETEDKMEKAIKVLMNELKGIRTGRANSNFLDPVRAIAYGTKTPLNQLANITVADSRMLTIQVWDKDLVKSVEKGIIEANLGVNPIVEGDMIRITLPQLTTERRKELVKISHKYGENTKISLRNIRRDAMDVIKKQEKDSTISKDDMHKMSENLQNLTDKYVKKIDQMVIDKEEEITKI